MRMEENKNEPIYPIGVVSRLLGISVHTLRMYEREGLIITNRGTNQKNRLYSNADFERIRCILEAIREKQFTIASLKTILSLIPCWKVINCPEEDRLDCPAYKSIGKPCWAFEHKANVCADRDCKTCSVYNTFTRCEEIKNYLKNI